VSQASFNLPLVLATSKNTNYKEYTGIEAVASDFSVESEEYALFNRMFSQNPRPAQVASYGFQYERGGEEGGGDEPQALADVMNELIKSHNDFFYLVSVEQGDEEIKALAEWTSTQNKIYVATTSNVNLKEELEGKYDNVFIIVYNQPELYPDAGLVGALAPQQVGSYTYTFTTINGIPPAQYDNTTINAIHEANMNTYIREGGVNIVSNGQATSGEYIDVIEGQYFINAKITENVFGLLARLPKLPQSNGGISLTTDQLDLALSESGENGIIATTGGEFEYTIDIPDINDIPTNDKANRILPDINWTATIAGAFEKVEINGVLTI